MRITCYSIGTIFMNAVEVNDLTFSYADGDAILRGVSFCVSEGELFAIGGSSGSGKTTLCRILCGIIPNAVKGILSGAISVAGIDPTAARLSQVALHIGMVFQETDSQIICTAVEDELAFGLENLCRPPDEIKRRVDELLSEFGLEALRYTDPARLSGGQKKLLTIAAVLATSPPVLIMDEPLSGLDPDGRGLVLAAIGKQRLNGRTVIIVDHDLKALSFADKWLLLRDGIAAALGTPADIARNEEMLAELGVLA